MLLLFPFALCSQPDVDWCDSRHKTTLLTFSSILVVVAALSRDICLLSSSRSPRVRLLSHETPTVSDQVFISNDHGNEKNAKKTLINVLRIIKGNGSNQNHSVHIKSKMLQSYNLHPTLNVGIIFYFKLLIQFSIFAKCFL